MSILQIFLVTTAWITLLFYTGGCDGGNHKSGYDTLNRELSPDTGEIQPILGDPGGPSKPANLEALSTTGNWVELHWQAPITTNNPIVAYRIYRDGIQIGTVDLTYDGKNSYRKRYAKTRTYIDCNYLEASTCDKDQPVPGMTYHYFITAVDKEGLESSSSFPLEFTFPNTLSSPLAENPKNNPDYKLVFEENFSEVTPEFLRKNWESRRLWDRNSSEDGVYPYNFDRTTQLVLNGELGFGIDFSNQEQTKITNPFHKMSEGLRITSEPKADLPTFGFKKYWDPKLQKIVSGRPYTLPYTTGILRSKQAFNRGYFEARMRLSGTHGFLSTFYLFNNTFGIPQGQRFGEGEIDIVEYLGGSQDLYDGIVPNRGRLIYHTYHYHGKHNDEDIIHRLPGTQHELPKQVHWSKEFHTYGVLWEKGLLIYTIDDKEVFRIEGPSVTSDPKYMILSLVAGGEWAGPPNRLETAQLDIDYVRVFQKKETGAEIEALTAAFSKVPTGVQYRKSADSSVLMKLNESMVCNVDKNPQGTETNPSTFMVLEKFGLIQGGVIEKCSRF